MFFIDDVIDNIKGQIDRRFTPFYIRLKDNSDTKETVSYEARRLKIKLFYKQDLAKKLRNLDPTELEEAFNRDLDIESETADSYYDLDDDLYFSLETVKTKSSDPGYFEAHFISNEIVLDESQKITASFDVYDFMDEFNIDRDIKDNSQEDILRIKPIIIEIKKDYIFTANPEAYDSELDFFIPQSLSTSLGKEVTIGDIEEINFQTYRKGRLKKTFAKLLNKKFVLEPELRAELNEVLTENEASYQLDLPLRFDLANPLKASFFRTRRKFKILLPIAVDARTSDGLELRIKIFSKVKLEVL